MVVEVTGETPPGLDSSLLLSEAKDTAPAASVANVLGAVPVTGKTAHNLSGPQEELLALQHGVLGLFEGVEFVSVARRTEAAQGVGLDVRVLRLNRAH